MILVLHDYYSRIVMTAYVLSTTTAAIISEGKHCLPPYEPTYTDEMVR